MSAILVIDGHPNSESFGAGLARRYASAAGEARLIALRDLDFDVHQRLGYQGRMEMEPDLVEARRAIREAEHLVVVTPVWWRSVPALLKGFLDRSLLPGEDYRYTPRGLPEGLLKGRSARVIATSDTPDRLQVLMPDARLRSLRRGTLAFCGFAPVLSTRFAPVRTATPQRRERWLEETARLAARDAQTVSRRIARRGPVGEREQAPAV